MKIIGCSLIFHISAFDLDYNLYLRKTIPNESLFYVPVIFQITEEREILKWHELMGEYFLKSWKIRQKKKPSEQ